MKILTPIAQSVIRHILTLVSGYLLAMGVEPQAVEQFSNATTPILLAIVFYTISQGWSLIDKKK